MNTRRTETIGILENCQEREVVVLKPEPDQVELAERNVCIAKSSLVQANLAPRGRNSGFTAR